MQLSISNRYDIVTERVQTDHNRPVYNYGGKAYTMFRSNVRGEKAADEIISLALLRGLKPIAVYIGGVRIKDIETN